MRKILVSLLLMIPAMASGDCDFSESIPESWLQVLPEDQIQAHIDFHNINSCKVINKYFVSIGKPERDCSKIPAVVPPVLRLKQPGDTVAYFFSPEECRADSTQPLYAGYALFRNGKQVSFELRVGTHNKALKWETQSEALAAP